MKKADVLQLTIVLIGIVFGFVALQYLFTSLYGIFALLFSLGYGGNDYYGPVVTNIAVIGLEVISSWVLITKSEQLAVYLHKKTNLGKGFKIIARPNDLLYILLIAIGIYIFLQNISPFLTAIYETFIQRSPRGVRGLFEDERPVAWTRLILNIIVPLVLLMFAKPIADYFARNIGEEPISIEESFDGADISESKED
jgi:hypothetical protein